MSPIGSAHSQDNSIVSTVIVLHAEIKNIAIKELTSPSLRKAGLQEAQPDIAYYVGKNSRFPPRNNAPVNLNELDPPTLVEVAASSFEDDRDRKQKLYQRMGVQEYWVVNVNVGKVIASCLTPTQSHFRGSQVLPELDINLVEEALKRSHNENDGAISRWLIATLIQQ